MIRIISSVFIFIHLSIRSQYYNVVREQRTVLYTCRYLNSDPPDLQSRARLPPHYNDENAQLTTVLFIIYFCIISHLVAMSNNQNSVIQPDPEPVSLGLILGSKKSFFNSSECVFHGDHQFNLGKNGSKLLRTDFTGNIYLYNKGIIQNLLLLRVNPPLSINTTLNYLKLTSWE